MMEPYSCFRNVVEAISLYQSIFKKRIGSLVFFTIVLSSFFGYISISVGSKIIFNTAHKANEEVDRFEMKDVPASNY